MVVLETSTPEKFSPYPRKVVPYWKLLNKAKFQLISKYFTGGSDSEMAYTGENLLKMKCRKLHFATRLQF